MPILPPEPFLFPDDLFAASAATGTEACPWWVLHTRPRVEKSLARGLRQRGIGFFLPLYQKRWRSRGRLLTAQLPLFPGYVFLCGDAVARREALLTNWIVQCLPVADQPRLHTDLSHVHQLMISGAPLTPEDRLKPGMLVEIISGPLAGLQGKLLRRGKHQKFFVEVHLLQRGVSVEIDGWMLEPVDR